MDVEFKYLGRNVLISNLFVQQGLNLIELEGNIVVQSASFGAHTVAEVNRKGGESALWCALEAGTQTADHCKVLNVGQTRSARSAARARQKSPQTSAHDHPSEWCECRWCLNSTSLLQLLFTSALFHSPD